MYEEHHKRKPGGAFEMNPLFWEKKPFQALREGRPDGNSIKQTGSGHNLRGAPPVRIIGGRTFAKRMVFTKKNWRPPQFRVSEFF